jgi:hypothetical protein
MMKQRGVIGVRIGYWRRWFYVPTGRSLLYREFDKYSIDCIGDLVPSEDRKLRKILFPVGIMSYLAKRKPPGSKKRIIF